MNLFISALPAFTDNYIWALVNPEHSACAFVDPGEASAVINFIAQHNYKPTAILITHKHWDHCGGLAELTQQFSMPVYGPAEASTFITHPVKDKSNFFIEKLAVNFEVLAIPGHTLEHVAYLGETKLFSGDTLFAAGCGRIFEGTAAQMYQRLLRLKALPEQTKIYCGHEYTLANLKFAALVEPDNPAIKKRLKEVEKLRAGNKISLPSTIALEKSTNPFLRCEASLVQQRAEKYAQKLLKTPLEVFQVLREWKNNFS